MAATLHSPTDLIPGKLAALDAEFASAMASLSSRTREQALSDTIAHHKLSARRVLLQAKARRRWLDKLEADDPGIRRFYRDRTTLTLAHVAAARAHINRALAELHALRVQTQRAA